MPDPTLNATDAELVMDLVDQRFSVLQRLDELTEQQAAAVERGHMSNLLEVLQKKQTPLNELARLSKSLSSAARDPEQRRWPTLQHKAQYVDKHQRCETLLQDLLRAEHQCEQALQTQHTRLAEELRQAQGVGRAIESYSAASQAPAVTGSNLDLSSG